MNAYLVKRIGNEMARRGMSFSLSFVYDFELNTYILVLTGLENAKHYFCISRVASKNSQNERHRKKTMSSGGVWPVPLYRFQQKILFGFLFFSLLSLALSVQFVWIWNLHFMAFRHIIWILLFSELMFIFELWSCGT